MCKDRNADRIFDGQKDKEAREKKGEGVHENG